MAQFQLTGFKAVAYRYALVEHKTFTPPQAFCLWHGFQILQDTPLQMVHLIQPFGLGKGGGFFTPNATGAEHGHTRLAALCQKFLTVLAEPCRKFPKGFNLRVYRAFKRAYGHFVIIARVYQNGVGVF